MSTIHIDAEPGDFAEIVLMPGDPLRAKMIAERWLEQAKLVTATRNMFGYTGYYQGKRLSVMAHGMGIPSASIYATELIREFGVHTLIRVGSCGAVAADVKVRDVLIAMGGCTDSKVNRMRFMDHDFAALADYRLLATAVAAAQDLNVAVRVGNVFSADLFYGVQPQMLDVMRKMKVLAVEMEVAGLYGLAAEYGARALGILTVADHLMTGEHLTADERQNSFVEMMEVALQTALRL